MIQFHRCPVHVRSFYDDAAQHPPISQRCVGIRTVPTDQIVGSVGRHQELRSDFLRARKPVGRPRETNRFWSVYKAMEGDILLPPIELFHLDDRYYVLDGNHRVAAALRLGQMAIDALVTECYPENAHGEAAMTMPHATAA